MLAHARGFRWTHGLMAVLSLALLFSASTSTVHAQAPRGLSGTVLDPDSKAVVGAAVVIRNEATGELVTTATDGSGTFAAATLWQGTYAIEVFVPGFETVRRSGVRVSEGTPAS